LLSFIRHAILICIRESNNALLIKKMEHTMSKRTQNTQAQIETTELVGPTLPTTTETTTQEVVTEVVTPTPTGYMMDGSQGPSLIEKHGSVSAAIRFLNSENHTRGQIAKILNKRFQHVRNVLITPLKKSV
jgi:hypothetical protein